MSFVTTARFTWGHKLRLSRSTSAVLPLPTGPATPTRKARLPVISKQKVSLRHGQLPRRLACQQFSIGTDFVGFRIHFQLWSRRIVDHIRLADLPAILDGPERLPQAQMMGQMH